MADIERLYWLGNCAKTRIIAEVLGRAAGSPAKVFDFGCGAGGDWPQILRDHPQLEFLGWDPHEASLAEARNKLAGLPNATVLSRPELEESGWVADFIVSFSVFEHVYDRLGYLDTARRHLAPKGVMYLNYDDGHFRTLVDLHQPIKTWRSPATTEVRNRLAGLLPHLGRQDLYQGRVERMEIAELVTHALLREIGDFYSNLDAMKGLFKLVPPDRQEAFAAMWLDLEHRLNDEFRSEGDEFAGDVINLWSRMASRTVLLTHL